MDGLLIGSGSLIPQPDAYSEVLDCDLNFTSRGTEESDTWYASSGTTTEYYLNGDSARTDDTLADSSEAWLQTIVESDSAETIKFYWKVSSESGGDYLQFYIDSTLKDQISGEVGWQQKSYPVLAGTHTLKWRYVKNGSVSSGENRAWVDFVQWTGPSPAQDPSNWQQIAYKHDVGGRRVEKKVDGYSTRYVYDGPHVIAEYDGNNNLLRKYIYGPGIDQPVSMIEVADANAVYYYHHDGLGSIVALSNAAGDTVQTYEYSVYGEVAVEDANHPNPYMFAGVRYDIEIGLYYNRARYYNPFTGRFLQTDPIGYGAGMNLYAYCKNSPLNLTDPFGRDPCDSGDPCDGEDINDINDVNGVADPETWDWCYMAGASSSSTAAGTSPPGANDGFSSAWEAALAAGQDIMSKPGFSQREYFYWIYEDGKGRFHYTPPVASSKQKSVTDKARQLAEDRVPAGAKIVAWGHNHPDVGGDSDYFSGTDPKTYQIIDRRRGDIAYSQNADGHGPMDAYVIGQSGGTLRYDHKNDIVVPLY